MSQKHYEREQQRHENAQREAARNGEVWRKCDYIDQFLVIEIGDYRQSLTLPRKNLLKKLNEWLEKIGQPTVSESYMRERIRILTDYAHTVPPDPLGSEDQPRVWFDVETVMDAGERKLGPVKFEFLPAELALIRGGARSIDVARAVSDRLNIGKPGAFFVDASTIRKRPEWKKLRNPPPPELGDRVLDV